MFDLKRMVCPISMLEYILHKIKNKLTHASREKSYCGLLLKFPHTISSAFIWGSSLKRLKNSIA